MLINDDYLIVIAFAKWNETLNAIVQFLLQRCCGMNAAPEKDDSLSLLLYMPC